MSFISTEYLMFEVWKRKKYRKTNVNETVNYNSLWKSHLLQTGFCWKQIFKEISDCINLESLVKANFVFKNTKQNLTWNFNKVFGHENRIFKEKVTNLKNLTINS